MDNRDIVCYISDFLSNLDILNLTLVKKDYKNYLTQKLKDRKYKVIQNIFPPLIVELINKNRFVDMPYLKWKPGWLGSTSYIDRIQYGQSSSSMWFTVDIYNRSALVIDIKATIYYDNQESSVEHGCIAIFKRYTHSIGFTKGTCYSSPFNLLCTVGMINENNDILLLSLIRNGEAIFDNTEKHWWFDKTVNKILFEIP